MFVTVYFLFFKYRPPQTFCHFIQFPAALFCQYLRQMVPSSPAPTSVPMFHPLAITLQKLFCELSSDLADPRYLLRPCPYCYQNSAMIYFSSIIWEKNGCNFCPPSEIRRRVMPMNAMEVMTLVLVIFAALSYIDHHNDKKK